MTAAPAIQGWCPGALRPMLSGDGWIVRVRPPEGRLTAAQAAALADLAETCGNGQIQLTNRANLQLRGIRPAAVGPLVAGLVRAGLVDPALPPDAEARLNILVTPDWTDGDPTLPLWHRLHAALTAPDAPALPSKFGFALDTAARRHLTAASADIRIETAGRALCVRADGLPTGRAAADAAQAVALAMDMARWFAASGGVGPDGRGRMRDHIARGAGLPRALQGDTPPAATADRHPDLVTPAFGQIAAATLRALAALGPAPMRLTPWRAVHLPRIPDAPGLRAIPDLIHNPADPRLRVTACTGAPGCAQGRGPTRAVAAALAPALPPDATLHVSGCAKGCAHPGPATLTLVAQGHGRYGVVRGGTAADPPAQVLDTPSLPTLLTAPVPHAPHL